MRVSQIYVEIMNICNVAKDHKKNCVDAHCNVSLFQLKQTALRLREIAPITEDVDSLINAVDWM